MWKNGKRASAMEVQLLMEAIMIGIATNQLFDFMKSMNIAMVIKPVWHNLLQTYIHTTISDVTRVVPEIICKKIWRDVGSEIGIAADAWFDSRGFTAMFGLIIVTEEKPNK